MKKSFAPLFVAATVGAIASAASAELVTGSVTADNHYALYSSAGSVFTYHGGNELDAAGDPGSYNWSLAESYSFEAGDFLYIAAWSDDAVAQGLICEFHSDSLGTILSGDSRWQVYGTNINRGDGDPHPSALEIAGHVNSATLGLLWETPFVGDANGVEPWGNIAGISEAARWMWKDIPGDDDPMHGGTGAAEMLIFRTTIPGPGSLALLGVGALGIRGRKRRS